MSSAQCFLLSPKDRDLLLKAVIPQNKFILPWSFLLCQCSSDITNQVHTRLCVPDTVLLHHLWCTSGSEFSMAHPRAQVFWTQGPCLHKCFSCYQECVLLQSSCSGVWKSEARRVLDLWSQLLCWKGWPEERASFCTVECKGTGGWLVSCLSSAWFCEPSKRYICDTWGFCGLVHCPHSEGGRAVCT